MAWSQDMQSLAGGNASVWQVQDAGLINEIIEAVNERSHALGTGDAFTQAVAGDAANSRAATYSLQRWIKDHYRYFCPRKDPGNNYAAVSGPGYFTGRMSIPTWADYTWEQFCQSAGCGAGTGTCGFRRVQGDAWPQDWGDRGDGAYSAGMVNGDNWQPASGSRDLVGPWVLVDMYHLLNELRWVCLPSADLSWSYDGLADDQRSGYGVHAAWSGARAAATGRYVDDPELLALGGIPRAWSRLYWQQSGSREAGSRRARAYCKVTGRQFTNAAPRDVDWYAGVYLPAASFNGPNIFAAYGDPPSAPGGAFQYTGGSHGPLCLWRTDAGDQTATPISGGCLGEYEGLSNMPGGQVGSWPAEPTVQGTDNALGWTAAARSAVLRFDVGGGFSKIAT